MFPATASVASSTSNQELMRCSRSWMLQAGVCRSRAWSNNLANSLTPFTAFCQD